MSGRFDDMLLAMAQELGSIDSILYEFFGFLKRRTDFFLLANPGDRAGFPPGAAEQMIYRAYKQHREEFDKEHPFTPRKETPQEKKPEPKQEPKKEPKKEPKEESKDPKSSKVTSDISTYNGGETDKYKWSQDMTDVTVQIKLPEGTKSKDIIVDFKPKKLKVAFKGKPQPEVEGDLYEAIHIENSFWQIDEGSLIISMEKAKESVWKCVVLGDAEIDPKTVDTTRRVDEYDEETQMGIRKVMHEHERKMKGLPSTDEEKAYEAMQKMWKESPYANEPFDPSKLMNIAKPAQPSEE